MVVGQHSDEVPRRCWTLIYHLLVIIKTLQPCSQRNITGQETDFPDFPLIIENDYGNDLTSVILLERIDEVVYVNFVRGWCTCCFMIHIQHSQYALWFFRCRSANENTALQTSFIMPVCSLHKHIHTYTHLSSYFVASRCFEVLPAGAAWAVNDIRALQRLDPGLKVCIFPC